MIVLYESQGSWAHKLATFDGATRIEYDSSYILLENSHGQVSAVITLKPGQWLATAASAAVPSGS